MDEKEFTHLTQSGVHMVEVGDKPIIKRTALARGTIKLQDETIELIEKGELKKGNVLTTAQIAAIQAVKNTPGMIPLCHPIPIGGVEVEFEVNPESIEVTVQVSSTGKTGVEMEAITGAELDHWPDPDVRAGDHLPARLPGIHGRIDHDRAGALHRHGHRVERIGQGRQRILRRAGGLQQHLPGALLQPLCLSVHRGPAAEDRASPGGR